MSCTAKELAKAKRYRDKRPERARESRRRCDNKRRQGTGWKPKHPRKPDTRTGRIKTAKATARASVKLVLSTPADQPPAPWRERFLRWREENR